MSAFWGKLSSPVNSLRFLGTLVFINTGKNRRINDTKDRSEKKRSGKAFAQQT